MIAECLVIGGIAFFFTVFFGILGGLCMMSPREPAKAIFCWIAAVAMAIIAATMFFDAYRLSDKHEQAAAGEVLGMFEGSQAIVILKDGGAKNDHKRGECGLVRGRSQIDSADAVGVEVDSA